PNDPSNVCFHVCTKSGLRLEDETSAIERKDGEYFHCPKCYDHFHVDVNAKRNKMHVQQPNPSAVSGQIS
ncbi:MAG: hypothetical protein ACXACG_15570, partial [Candidatus Thorarchaeota archaeon]